MTSEKDDVIGVCYSLAAGQGPGLYIYIVTQGS